MNVSPRAQIATGESIKKCCMAWLITRCKNIQTVAQSNIYAVDMWGLFKPEKKRPSIFPCGALAYSLAFSTDNMA